MIAVKVFFPRGGLQEQGNRLAGPLRTKGEHRRRPPADATSAKPRTGRGLSPRCQSRAASSRGRTSDDTSAIVRKHSMPDPHRKSDPQSAAPEETSVDALDLDDDDVLDAMRQIPGYLDISTEDFRALYLLAQAHARQRLLRGLRAADLMLVGIRPLAPDWSLHVAATCLVEQGLKALPVTAPDGTVTGILTETDFLGCFAASSYLELLLRLDAASPGDLARCRGMRVDQAMSAPAICVSEQARAPELLAAFRRHPGRSMPVIGADGRLRGLLLRKDLLHAAHLEDGAA
jgi:CBS-domain-containing membrane protein